MLCASLRLVRGRTAGLGRGSSLRQLPPVLGNPPREHAQAAPKNQRQHYCPFTKHGCKSSACPEHGPGRLPACPNDNHTARDVMVHMSLPKLPQLASW